MPQYTDRFEEMFPYIMDRECEYIKGHHGDWRTNNGEYVRPEYVTGDDGGWTKFGVDQRAHPRVNIKGLTLSSAKEIYAAEWTKAPVDEGELPKKTAFVFFDINVLGGNAGEWLQHILNDMGEKLDVDGHVGPMTIEAAKRHNDSEIALKLLQRRRLYYQRVVASHPEKKQFLEGWLNRNVELADFFEMTFDRNQIA